MAEEFAPEAGLAASERENALRQLEAKLDLMTRAKMASTGIPYHQALKLVVAENPQLDQQRTRLIRGER